MHAWSILLCLLLPIAGATGEDTTISSATDVTATENALPPTEVTPDELVNLAKTLEGLLGEPIEELVVEAAEHGTGPSELLGYDSNGAITPDVYTTVSPQHHDVQKLVSEFMRTYQSEIDVANLDASVLSVVKAEKTAVRPELAERSFGLGVDLIEEKLAQRFRVVVLMKYVFKSSMFTDKRPYVTAMRVTMDCANVTASDHTNDNVGSYASDDNTVHTVHTAMNLECDVLEHTDLPRTHESTTDVPAYIQRAVEHSAPSAFLERNQSALAHVYYEAVESQAVATDSVVEYVRFRVTRTDIHDCILVLQHADGVSALLYADTVCFRDYMALSLATAALQFTKDHYEPLTVVAALVGALVAVVLVYRRRVTHKRSGYAYLPTKHGLQRLASQQSTKSSALDAASAVAS